MIYVDAYLLDGGVIHAGNIDQFERDATAFENDREFGALSKVREYLRDLGDDEVIIISRTGL